MEIKNLNEAVKFCFNDKVDYPPIFEDNCGVGIKVPEKKLHALPAWKNVRTVMLEIRTFAGVSFGAMHYYGKLIIDGVHMAYDDNPERSTMLIENPQYPLCDYKYNLRVHRELTKREKQQSPDRWSNYQEGDLTNCFETYEEIVEQAKQIFKLRFKGSWKLLVEYPWGRKEKLI